MILNTSRNDRSRLMTNDNGIVCEGTEDAIARGISVQRFESGKVSKRKIKKQQEQSGEQGEQVDIRLLMSRCNPEQKEKLRKIVEEQGIDLD